MTIFTQITFLVAIAAAVSIIMRWLRQPLIIGYIATGLLAGPLVFNVIRGGETLQLFSEIGVALLLFIVGLNLSPKAIREFGKVAAITGLGQIVFTASIGFVICLALGFSAIVSAYLAIALALSSTIIVLKLLSDRGDLDKLYGRISVGFLIVQDLAAIIILFFIPLLSPDNSPLLSLLIFLKAAAVVIAVFIVAYKVLPLLNNFLASSSELLFLFSLAWGLGLSALFRAAGLSLETGALLAGITLSILPSHTEIHARLRPLRDFFLVVFFVLLGAGVAAGDLRTILWPAILLSLFVLIGNPLILMIIMGIMGYRKKVSFQTGLTTAQISEFSLILVALGLHLGHVSTQIVSLITIVGIITIFGSSYLVMHSEQIYSKLGPFLHWFERKKTKPQTRAAAAYELALFGYNRIGFDFLNMFRRLKKPFLVVDYDPETVDFLGSQKISNEFGDAADVDFLRLLDLRKLSLAVSTIPDLHTNIVLLSEVRRQSPRAAVMVVAHTIGNAQELYKRGADYVIMPHFLGGNYAALMAEELGLGKRRFLAARKKHQQYLEKRLAKGHEHPLPEKWH